MRKLQQLLFLHQEKGEWDQENGDSVLLLRGFWALLQIRGHRASQEALQKRDEVWADGDLGALWPYGARGDFRAEMGHARAEAGVRRQLRAPGVVLPGSP